MSNSGDRRMPCVDQHALRAHGQGHGEGHLRYQQHVERELKTCTLKGLGNALHAVQDSWAPGHQGPQVWAGGIPDKAHRAGDIKPPPHALQGALNESMNLIRRYMQECPCDCN